MWRKLFNFEASRKTETENSNRRPKPKATQDGLEAGFRPGLDAKTSRVITIDNKFKLMRFLGNSEAKADTKGRVFLPAVFRKILQVSGEEKLVMRKDVFQPCLVLYPESVWNGQMDLLRQRLNRWNAEHQQIFRQFVSDVELISLDGNGRFLIPKRYLKLANIEQGIKVIGMGDTIEIWRNAPESQSFMSSEEFGKALQEVMRDTQQTVDGQ